MLLDTCIIIDVLRGRDAAVEFVRSLPDIPSLSAITATEIVAGCRSMGERREIDRLLGTYVIREIGLEIATLAGEYVRKYGSRHGVDPIDAIIAATAKVCGLELATLNLKHFPMFQPLARPYEA